MLRRMPGAILLIDDDPVFRGLARRVLTASGLEIGGEAASVAEARALARQAPFSAAMIDVTDPEPPLAGNPLVGLRNCIVAPHIASATVSSRDAMAEIAADNLIAGLKGEPLRAWVNPEVATNRRKGADLGD